MNAPKKPLRILSIVPFPLVPVRSGGQQKSYQLLRALSKKNEVTCLTPKGESVMATPFALRHDLIGSKFRYFQLTLLFTLRNVHRDFDLIMVDQPFWFPLAYLLKKIANLPLVLHGHNLEYERFRSMGKSWWRVVELFERFAFNRADLLLFITDRDREQALKRFNIPTARAVTVPFGIEKPEPLQYPQNHVALRKALGLPPDVPIFLFYGKLDYAPNAQAVELLLNKVLPLLRKYLPDAVLLIAGKNLPIALRQAAQKAANVRYLGFVPDLAPYLTVSTAVLNPILAGGGVKTKCIEAMAYGKVVVSTRTGAQGIEPSVSKGLLRISSDDDWRGFVENMVQIKQVVLESREAFLQYYYIGNIADRLTEKLYKLTFTSS